MKRFSGAFFSFLLPLVHTTSHAQQAFEKLEGFGNILIQKNVMIPAPDGISLATDIYRLADGERPVDTPQLLLLLLQRTPYGKTSERFVKARIYCPSFGKVAGA